MTPWHAGLIVGIALGALLGACVAVCVLAWCVTSQPPREPTPAPRVVNILAPENYARAALGVSLVRPASRERWAPVFLGRPRHRP